MKSYLLLILFLYMSCLLFSQDSTTTNKQHISIKSWSWRLNDKKINQSELKAEMLKVPEAATYFFKYKTRATFSYSLLAAGSIISILAINRNKQFNDENLGLKISGGILLTSGFILLFPATKNRNKAINLYNSHFVQHY